MAIDFRSKVRAAAEDLATMGEVTADPETNTIRVNLDKRPRVLNAPDRKRELVTGGDPDARYPAPSENTMEGVEFAQAADLEEIGQALIYAHRATFSHLDSLTVTYLWRAKGGKSAGKPVLGKCQKPAGLLAYFANTSWVIALAADHARDFGLSRWQVEGVLFHELLHAGEDVKTMEPSLLPHDTEVFAAEIEEYGLWSSDLCFVAKAFRTVEQLQLPLDLAGEE